MGLNKGLPSPPALKVIKASQKPNQTTKLMNVNVNINSDGLRDRDHNIDNNKDKNRIIFVGRLETQKNLELLINSIARLSKTNRQLLLIGSGILF